MDYKAQKQEYILKLNGLTGIIAINKIIRHGVSGIKELYFCRIC